MSASIIVGVFMFSKHGPRDDLSAYATSLLGLLTAAYASTVLYPARNSFRIRLIGTIAILLTAFWALEFLGGVAWYTLNKLARHY